jgi:hypothetical protein
MKLHKLKILLIAFIIIGSAGTAQAQFMKKLKDKVNTKLAEIEEKAASGGVVLPDSATNQAEYAAKFNSGEYAWYECGSSCYNEKEDTKMKVDITKDASGKVTKVVIDDGSKGGEFVPDEDGKSEFARYFKNTKSGGGRWHLYFAEDRIILFTKYADFEDKGSINIDGSIMGFADYRQKERIGSRLVAAKAFQKADLEEYTKNQAAAEAAALAERKAKYSIEGKNVASIKVVDLKVPEKFGHYRSFSYDIEATLKDGTKISTADNGFRSDYKINLIGADLEEYTGKIKPKFIDNDKIVISVQSKYQPSIKTTKDVVLKYNEPLRFDWGAREWGKNGENLRMKVKAVKHKVTGEDLLQVSLYNLTRSEHLAEFKIQRDVAINILLNGQPGYTYDSYFANDSGVPGNGGNGGNLELIKDPNVDLMNLNFQTNGGAGGQGPPLGNNGRNGRDGKLIEKVTSVSF